MVVQSVAAFRTFFLLTLVFYRIAMATANYNHFLMFINYSFLAIAIEKPEVVSL